MHQIVSAPVDTSRRWWVLATVVALSVYALVQFFILFPAIQTEAQTTESVEMARRIRTNEVFATLGGPNQLAGFLVPLLPVLIGSMMDARDFKIRPVGLGLGLIALAVASMLVLNAFQSNLVFFFTPTQVANAEVPKGRGFRIGGMVENGSLTREGDGLTVHFVVTDLAKRVPVTFKGILPDLFKEGKGVVAQGQLGADGTFLASEVLAKHDENYMPPEAAAALAKAKAAGAQSSSTLVVNPR